MKHSSLVKSLQKVAPIKITEHKKGINERGFRYEIIWFQCSYGRKIVEWTTSLIDNHNEASSLRTRYSEDKDEIQSDYCAGSFRETIKECLNWLTK